ncbi:hypothetical protein [Marinomonas ostreistagni]|uniref:hypothetical protein n=1 Tax=Marinomonas ostreistagni TaxID=359209 RepID=UPI00195149ED|nr:hypothetical protein [Marinomonas ostreistagni]MBM6550383.1 hypothetical protein [Marinomonas ostreistagni]
MMAFAKPAITPEQQLTLLEGRGLTIVDRSRAPHASWKQRLTELFQEFPNTPLTPMGLPQDWQHDPFWQDNLRDEL